jgi:hypothetical protein
MMNTQQQTTTTASAQPENSAQWSLTEYDNEATIFDQYGNRICDASTLMGAQDLISKVNAIIAHRDELQRKLDASEDRNAELLAAAEEASRELIRFECNNGAYTSKALTALNAAIAKCEGGAK